MKNDRLATTGPYAYTRNPLYLGSFLIGMGFALAAHWGFVVVVALFFAFIYVPTMQRERVNISLRFPEAYAEYCAHVPEFVPRLSPWRQDGAHTDQCAARLRWRRVRATRAPRRYRGR